MTLLSTSISNVTCKRGLNNRVKVAHTAYGMLSHQIFCNHGFTIRTQIMVFQAVVLFTLLYTCGPCIIRASSIWSSSSKQTVESFSSVGRKTSTTTKSSLGHLSSESKLPSFNIASVRWVTCLEYVLQRSVENIPDTSQHRPWPWDLGNHYYKSALLA